MDWSTACPSWQTRIVAGEPLIPFPPLFPDEAASAREMFDSLRLVDVAGEPTIGEASRPWLTQFADAVFGSYDPQSGRRLIREFLLLVAKKNSKSTIAAAIMLTALLRNWRKSGELLILAPTIETAQNSFQPARDMIRADPELSDLLHVQEHYRTITHRKTRATLKVVAANNETVGGKKAAFVLIDELWLFGKQANAENMLREATGGLASRPEGFVIYLSTHSDAAPVGVFDQKLKYFRGVRDGRIKDRRSLPVLYEFPPAMLAAGDFKQPENWRITNPNLGASVAEEFIEHKLFEAQQAGAASLRGFYAKHLNVEIGLALGADRWPGAEFWTRATHPDLAKLPTFEALTALLDRSEVVVVGIDGGGLDDLFGLTVLGREPGEIEIEATVAGKTVRQKMARWLSWSHAWCHEGVLERRQSIASKLRDIQNDGGLTIVSDSLGDVGSIIEIIRSIKDEHGKLGGVAVDPAGLGEFVDALADIGVTQDNKLLAGVTQGYGMMNAIKTTERRLASGMLRHCGGLLMDWCVGNLKIEPTATAIRATKQNAGDAKIDPAMALFNAGSLMALNPTGAPAVAAMIV